MASSLDTKETPTLVTLPYDVKFLILKELISYREPIAIKKYFTWGKESICLTSRANHVGIVHACKDIYDDGIHLLYAGNTFSLEFDYDPHSVPLRGDREWLHEIGPSNRRRLTSLDLKFRVGSRHEYSIQSNSVYDSGSDFEVTSTYPESEEVRIEGKAVRADRVKNMINSIALSSMAGNLRRLELTFTFGKFGSSGQIIDITFLRAVSHIDNLTSLTIIGDDLGRQSTKIPHIYLQYLNRRLRIPIKHRADAMERTFLKKGIVRVEKDMKIVRGLVLETTYGTTSTRVEMPSLFADPDWSEENFNYSSGIVQNPLDQPECYCALGQSARDKAQRLPTLLRGLNAISSLADLSTGKYWPPVQYHKRHFEILAQKRQFLIEFWEELKTLGIPKKKGTSTNSEHED